MVLDRPNDKLDFTLAKWQVRFYLGQMTSPILPWPNDKSDRPNDKLDFTLAKWQVRSMKNTHVSNEEKRFFQKPHLFFEVYLGLFLRNSY